MGGGGRRSSQHAPPRQTYDATASGSRHSMGPPSHGAYSGAMYSPAQTSVRDGPSDRSQGAGSASYGYHDHHISSHELQTHVPIQSTQAAYSSFIQEPPRLSQIQHSSTQHQYPSYQQDYVLPPVQPNTFYDAVQQYQPRQPVTQEMMTGHFPLASYVPSNESEAMDVESGSSHYLMVPTNQPGYETTSLSRPQLSDSFTVPSSGYQVPEQPDQQNSQAVDPDRMEIEQSMRQHEQYLKEVFDAIVAGRVTEASQKLLKVSRWLLTSVVQLKLHHDDESVRDQRLLMWREFNHCWEALGQKQKNIAQAFLDTNRAPADSLTSKDVVRIVDEFVSLCDQVEEFALVDYELGVWEEQVVSVFISCLDLLSQIESEDPGSTG